MADDLLSPGYTAHDEERRVPEPPKRSARTAFARDRARVLHSAALRRLAAKTQVLVAGELDFPRTRLTHTLEVAQIGGELGAALGCDPDLVEVAGLAHDLGHPPFGHNGETALDESARAIGGFEGNAQSFRVLTRLEAKSFDDQGRGLGLNLTRAALDATSKYPWPRREGTRKYGVYDDDLEVFLWAREGAEGIVTCIEAQVMDWADDVAYSVHDVEDAVHAGYVDLAAFSAEPQALIDLAQRAYARDASHDDLAKALQRLIALPYWPAAYDGSLRSLAMLKNLTSQLIGRFCAAAERATREEYGAGHLTRYRAHLVIPDESRHEVAVMKAVAALYVMNREGAQEVYREQRALLAALVDAILERDGIDVEPWLQHEWSSATNDDSRLRVVIDQVASLTDVSVLAWRTRLL